MAAVIAADSSNRFFNIKVREKLWWQRSLIFNKIQN